MRFRDCSSNGDGAASLHTASLNQTVNQHFARNINTIITTSNNLRDTNILLSAIKTCMYSALESFQQLQIVEDSEDELENDDYNDDT